MQPPQWITRAYGDKSSGKDVYKRQPKDIRDEITPKNIIMSGPTGVGKTEIARRIAKITGAPFVKVEATKFTEVGYVGRDVDSMVRDLVEASIRLVREEKRAQLQDKLDRTAKNRLIDIILPLRKPKENETLEERRAIVTDDLDRGVLEDYIIAVSYTHLISDYRTATGLEAMLGYLFLTGQTERVGRLMQVILDNNGEHSLNLSAGESSGSGGLEN